MRHDINQVAFLDNSEYLVTTYARRSVDNGFGRNIRRRLGDESHRPVGKIDGRFHNMFVWEQR